VTGSKPVEENAPALAEARAVFSAATVIGIGMGAFLDGIVFHQILQVHSMLSGKVDRRSVVNLEINMFWDGVFHLFAWAATLTGVFLLWRALVRAQTRVSSDLLLGGMMLGWGAFNLVEGLVDHEILGLHHVLEDSATHLAPDLAFLALGGVLIVAGWRVATRPMAP
jgi:uncharacterized membrane protein